eukprot:jgi/Mesen1/4371/ME000221S03495
MTFHALPGRLPGLHPRCQSSSSAPIAHSQGRASEQSPEPEPELRDSRSGARRRSTTSDYEDEDLASLQLRMSAEQTRHTRVARSLV